MIIQAAATTVFLLCALSLTNSFQNYQSFPIGPYQQQVYGYWNPYYPQSWSTPGYGNYPVSPSHTIQLEATTRPDPDQSCCKRMRCNIGSYCVCKTIYCIRAPCPPRAFCEPWWKRYQYSGYKW
ncbi:uncharacterized protein LOC119459668 isoform X1 [Dermacentor silvarum]|uniref:uncharacterized protein LOC119459668 isoform X1 n=1 Tax=Dermacentor silvarum TaxID=543639 RepID=UPI0021009DFB|nr:uncharacterized protein LOC119459668 isoform X1 [Dermacentor silvarum]